MCHFPRQWPSYFDKNNSVFKYVYVYVYVGFKFYYLHTKILTKYDKRYDFNKSSTA